MLSYRSVTTGILLVILYSCVEPLSIPDDVKKQFIVVDGLITNERGPYRVEVYYNALDDEDANIRKPIPGATVTITDNSGNAIALEERIPGVYETDSETLQGEVGRDYQLLIETVDGKRLLSSWERMNENGDILDVSFRYMPGVLIPDDPGPEYDPTKSPKDAFDFYLDAKGVMGSPNLFLWRWRGTFFIRTVPEDAVRPTSGSVGPDGVPVTFVPNPLPCSGWIVDGTSLKKVGECVCCDCWAPESDDVVRISSPDLAQNGVYNEVRMARLPIDGIRLFEKYHFEVQQISLSENTYRFWKLVAAQQSSAANIFQPNIVRIRGNMTCTNCDEEILGIFGASAIVRKGIFIYPYDVPSGDPKQQELAVDCRAHFQGASTEKPEWW